MQNLDLKYASPWTQRDYWFVSLRKGEWILCAEKSTLKLGDEESRLG